jgi:hypothetical protein
LTAYVSPFRKSLAGAFVAAVLLIAAAPAAFAGNELAGQWTLTITIPDAPRSKTTRTFMVNLDVSPRGQSLHGRLNITDEAGMTVGGAWRQVGKNLSITYELPCSGDGSPCASLILVGRVKGGGVLIKKGSVVVMWDTPNDKNPALYDTSNGSFRGTRID